ncbi:MAG: hypothetical protein HND40_00600 [Ignavibacteriota bacterium]|jgi:hypothetical protein|nr:MAG: hypothetical protein F9K42_05480 [Ignavibacterium sp.]MBL1153492.1 hypothetical protein [Ignavibacteriota bacterium]MCO6448404.1 hypothetical protein [Ignavibacterium album]MCZ2269614.1 hypothetical protein [Ignavibacteriales bacterium]MDX9712410.1 hypothetical protein [Ignavibacteriaceae bacterium]
MTTLPPPKVRKFPEDSVESRVYALVESLDKYIEIPNDRNRLAYCLYKYLNNEGDEPKITLKNAKINFSGISFEELAKKLDEGLEKIK